MVLHADTLGTGVMLGSHEAVACRTLLQAWQHVEDATLAVVEQEDTEITLQVLVPQGILIVEETQVANDTIRPW